MLARVLGAVGRTLIAAGVLVLLFVVYEIWGTNLQEASAQRGLRKEFSAMEAKTPTTPPTTAPPVSGPVLTVPPVTAPPIPAPQHGQALGRLRIPKIGVDKTIVQGVTLDQLKRGPGHYPETPLPGQKGNAAIAGHRTTYGAPFHNIDKLAPGDDITVTTLQGTFHYRVDSKIIVDPTDVEVLQDKGDNRLTLSACHPKYSASQRIIVSGVLVGQPVAHLPGQERVAAASGRLAGGDEGRAPKDLDGPPASTAPAYWWAAACASVYLVAWGASRLVARRTKRRLLTWTPYAVGLPVFLVVLYVFFENFSRLLPANF